MFYVDERSMSHLKSFNIKKQIFSIRKLINRIVNCNYQSWILCYFSLSSLNSFSLVFVEVFAWTICFTLLDIASSYKAHTENFPSYISATCCARLWLNGFSFFCLNKRGKVRINHLQNIISSLFRLYICARVQLIMCIMEW